ACAAFTRNRFSPEIERDTLVRIYGKAPYKPICRCPSRPGWAWRDVLSRSAAYKQHRWGNANAKIIAASELRARGYPAAAKRCTLLALAGAPTLALRPARLRGLLPGKVGSTPRTTMTAAEVTVAPERA